MPAVDPMKQTFVTVLGLSVLLGACQYKTVHAPSLSARDAEYMALVGMQA